MGAPGDLTSLPHPTSHRSALAIRHRWKCRLTAFLGIFETGDRERLCLTRGNTQLNRHTPNYINTALKRARGYQVAFEAIIAHSDKIDIDKGRDVPVAASRRPSADLLHDRGSDGICPRKIVQVESDRSTT